MEKDKNFRGIISVAGSGIIVLLLLFIWQLIRSRSRMASSKVEIENFNTLLKTFIDANEKLAYLKDENLEYVFVNRAFEDFYHKKAQDVVGKDDFSLSSHEFAQLRQMTDLTVVEKKSLVIDQIKWQDAVFRTTKFPVKMLNGAYGIGAYVEDITTAVATEKRRIQSYFRNQILLDVFSLSFQSRKELLEFALSESLKLTQSQYGYIYLYDEKKQQFTLNSWSYGVMADCTIQEQDQVYQLEKTGIWGEVVRQSKSIVINDFAADNPYKKGYPNGHVELKRFMSVPVFVEKKIVAVVGLANKEEPYDDNDVYEMTLLMSGLWNAVQRREALENLSYERNKSLQTLLSIADGVMVVDQEGRVEMLNRVAEQLTGWTLVEAEGKHYKDIFVLSSDPQGQTVEDPIEGVIKTGQKQNLQARAVLTSKSGRQFVLEDSAAPILDGNGNTVGVVLVFRDATDKIEQQRHIEYLSFHDSLTGLYNRRFFEEEMRRLDTQRNLPIALIMGDVNNLKLTNDIFGHATGDLLLRKVAEVLKSVCRAEDIIARWGGDEFVLLLPNTNHAIAEAIAKRIKSEFAKANIKGIQGSISLGFEVKKSLSENLSEILSVAEEHMYVNKTLEKDEVRSIAMDAVVDAFNQHSQKDNEHAIRVSDLCEALGKDLGLPEDELKKLKEAAYLHDIGKIVLDSSMLDKCPPFDSESEWQEFKRHPLVGYRILNFFEATQDIAETVLSHQESWDGSGFPKGLRGEGIPFFARIICIVGTFDRLVRHPQEGKSVSYEQAKSQMKAYAGAKFDPKLTEIFLNMMDRLQKKRGIRNISLTD